MPLARMAKEQGYPEYPLTTPMFPLSSFLDKPSGRSSFAGLLPTGRKKAERPELAFDHEEIMKDAINVYGNIMN